MNPEDRRAAIVEATLPLLAEFGANVTTKQIAQAADIAEGTVFRVFADKEELLRTCVHEAFRTDLLAAEIRAVATTDALAERLAAAAELFLAHFARLGLLMNALATSGYDLRKGVHRPSEGDEADQQSRARPAEFVREPLAAVIELMEPDAHLFRIRLDHVAHMLFGLLFGRQLEPDNDRDDTGLTARQRVDVLLHGALKN